jgi:murein tripeptide amidase MpaA
MLAATTYIADFLLSDDAKAVELRSKFTFHVIPVLNVDGIFLAF